MLSEEEQPTTKSDSSNTTQKGNSAEEHRKNNNVCLERDALSKVGKKQNKKHKKESHNTKEDSGGKLQGMTPITSPPSSIHRWILSSSFCVIETRTRPPRCVYVLGMYHVVCVVLKHAVCVYVCLFVCFFCSLGFGFPLSFLKKKRAEANRPLCGPLLHR